MNPSSKSSKKPAVALTKVPSVKELCEKLGFRYASLKETNTFMDAAHAWRKTYKTSSGTSGTELLLWNAPSVQLDLAIMAERFLEDRGNADRFWSPTREWNQNLEVEYPEDRALIIELLKQLFWKQNRYAANNNAYGPKSVDSRDGSRTPMHQITRPEGNIPPGTTSSTDRRNPPQARRGAAPAPDGTPFSNFDREMAQGGTADFDVTRDQHEDIRPSVEKDKDIYELSDDDSIGAASRLQKSPAHSSKHARTEQTATSRDKTPRKKKKTSIGPSPRRRTGRKIIPRERPGMISYVSNGGYDESMKAPSSSEDSDEERPQDEDSHTLGVSKESTTKTSHSQTPSSNKAYTAPTAPMVVANETEYTVPLSRPMEAGKAPSSPRDHLSKVVRISMRGIKRPRPEPPEQSTSSPAQAVLAGQVDQETVTPPHSTQQSHTRGMASPTTTRPATEAKQWSPLNGNTYTRSPSYQQLSTETKGIEPGTMQKQPSQLFKNDNDGRNTSVESTSSRARSKTQVPLWIITREPRYTEELWDNGKFLGTLLSDFIKEVSKITQRNHIEKLKLTLRTPTFDTKITVFKDAEDSWVSAKETFVEKLKEARAEARAKRPNEQPSFKILVEPFYEQKAFMSSNVDEDDEEFDF